MVEQEICNLLVCVRFTVEAPYLGVAQFGSALDLGSRGCGFKSHHSDQKYKSIWKGLSMKRKALIGMMVVVTLTGCSNAIPENEVVTEEITVPVVSVYDYVKASEEVVEIVEEIIEPTPELTTELEIEVVEPVVELTTTETYRVTAYCACEKCCGKWALNRPVDEFGNEIVKGAAGVQLVNGYTVASPLPFGTKINLEGYGIVEVQDRTAKWIVEEHGENVIDIYFSDHDTAWDFGVKYWEGTIQ